MHSSLWCLTSNSPIKKSALKRCLEYSGLHIDSIAIPSEQIRHNEEQPVGIGGLICCKNRIKAVLAQLGGNAAKKCRCIVSIENAIDSDENGHFDVCHTMLYCTWTGIYYYNVGGKTYFEQRFFDLAKQNSDVVTPMGFSYTVGEAMKDCNLITDEKNWMSVVPCTKTGIVMDRHEQIFNVLKPVSDRFRMTQLSTLDLKGSIGYHLDFKVGVVFQDLGLILSQVYLKDLFFKWCIDTLKKNRIIPNELYAMSRSVDYVVGIEARGFYLGTVLADRLKAGFIPIRKKGKLPGTVKTKGYATEYSVDEMEIQTGVFPLHYDIERPYNFLLVDDLVATGGSLIAAANLVKEAYGPSFVNIVGCYCPLYVKPLFETAKQRFDQEKLQLIVNEFE
jgi:adenine phosphoribosyltransferase